MGSKTLAPPLSTFHPKEFVSLKEEVGEENLIRQGAGQIAYPTLAVGSLGNPEVHLSHQLTRRVKQTVQASQR